MQQRQSLGRLAAGAIAALAALAAVPASPAAPRAAPPLRMDLDAFDRAHRSAVLANGMTLAYVDTGDPQGRPVVLIHGYTDTSRDWVPLLPYLDPRQRLIVVDLRGHGRSARPECCYSRIDFAYDIRLLLDKLGIGVADIIGHSLGSIIAQTFAEYWPERTRRVVLISSTGGARGGCVADGGEPRSAASDFRTEIMKLADPIDPDSKFMVDWYDSPTPVDAEFLRRERRDAAAMPVRVWIAVLDQGLTDMDLQSTLARLAAPTLLIWGGKDPIFGAADRCSLRAALPHAQVQLFAELGHNPFWEDPEAVATVINPFLGATP